MWRNDVLKVLLIVFLGLLTYQLFIGGCDFAGKLAVNTINSIFVQPEECITDAMELPCKPDSMIYYKQGCLYCEDYLTDEEYALIQSHIDSAKGAGR